MPDKSSSKSKVNEGCQQHLGLIVLYPILHAEVVFISALTGQACDPSELAFQPYRDLWLFRIIGVSAMSDNAASHETAENEVHPEAGPESTVDSNNHDNASDLNAVDGAKESHQDVNNHESANNGDLAAEEGIVQTLAAAEENDAGLDMDEEGFDPATLANLAALSRLARDEGDDEEDIEHDFSSLVPESQSEGQTQDQTQNQNQQILTTEQVRDIVSRLGEERSKGSENGSEADEEILREKEETRTDDARTEVEDEDDDDGDYPGETPLARSKRKRNRTSL